MASVRAPGGWLDVLRATVSGFREDHGIRLAASLAFFSLFSLAPLLLITVSVAGFVVGEGAARAYVLRGIGSLLGARGEEALGSLLDQAAAVEVTTLGTMLTVATLVVGAVAAFVELKDAMNAVWDAEPRQRRRGVVGFLRDRVLSVGALLTVAFLSLSSLVLTAGLAAFGDELRSRFALPAAVWVGVNAAIALAATTILFAILFKFLPDAKIAWRDTWVGATATAVMFLVGQVVIGVSLSSTAAVSVYGAAGSLVLVLLWLFYSAIIFFLGAEFVQAWSSRFGDGVRPQPQGESAVRRLRERAT